MNQKQSVSLLHTLVFLSKIQGTYLAEILTWPIYISDGLGLPEREYIGTQSHHRAVLIVHFY